LDAFQQLNSLAVGWGHDSWLERLKGSESARQINKRWLRVFASQLSGKWVIVREEVDIDAVP
jgi:hypothetical protein